MTNKVTRSLLLSFLLVGVFAFFANPAHAYTWKGREQSKNVIDIRGFACQSTYNECVQEVWDWAESSWMCYFFGCSEEKQGRFDQCLEARDECEDRMYASLADELQK